MVDNDKAGFFRDHHAKFDPKISNYGYYYDPDVQIVNAFDIFEVNRRLALRMKEDNGPEIADLYKVTNGLQLIDIPENMYQLRSAELGLEMWGGDGGTRNKRVVVNGHSTYQLPDSGTELMASTFSYPFVPLDKNGLIPGINTFQYACDNGKSKHGGNFCVVRQFIRVYLKKDHPDLIKAGIQNFTATMAGIDEGGEVGDTVELSLNFPESFKDQIESVDFFARYQGFDDNGNALDGDWHGYLSSGELEGHLGSCNQQPYSVVWNTHMLPTQEQPMALKAAVHLKGGICYWTPTVDHLRFPTDRSKVESFSCYLIPQMFMCFTPGSKKSAILELPEDISGVKEVQLSIKVLDWWKAKSDDRFTLNGHEIKVTPDPMKKITALTQIMIPANYITGGENKFTLHRVSIPGDGIEVLPPDPCLTLRY